MCFILWSKLYCKSQAISLLIVQQSLRDRESMKFASRCLILAAIKAVSCSSAKQKNILKTYFYFDISQVDVYCKIQYLYILSNELLIPKQFIVTLNMYRSIVSHAGEVFRSSLLLWLCCVSHFISKCYFGVSQMKMLTSQLRRFTYSSACLHRK